jgi:glutamine amidotransferase
VSQPGAVDIAIIDYGMGNLRNVQKAFEHIGIEARISSQPADLKEADGWVLPGVGAFGDAMENLHSAGLVEPIRRGTAQGKPLLGICLGLQLLFEESNEMGDHRGLGVLPGRVTRFEDGMQHAGQTLKVPHVGWNQFHLTAHGAASPLLAGVPDGSYAYFVHSYYVVPADRDAVLAVTDYGIDFVSVVGRGHVFGAQPHPEKSQEVGLRLLQNYARIVAERDPQIVAERDPQVVEQVKWGGGDDHLSGH